METKDGTLKSLEKEVINYLDKNFKGNENFIKGL